MYLGDRRPRLTGEAYDAFLEEFVTATQVVFPGAVVQFEDFNNTCAFRLLRRYQDRLCCFDDDVQVRARWDWPGCTRRAESPGGH
jgi:malate dehydrogenase (oxaloacetate-decarboxylating)(NADP+)